MLQNNRENPCGLQGFAFLEFSGPDSKKIQQQFEDLGFVKTASHPEYNITRYQQGQIQFIVNGEPNCQASAHAKIHGAGACAMGFQVADAEKAYQHAIKQGAKPFEEEQANHQLRAIEAIGGSVIYFVDDMYLPFHHQWQVTGNKVNSATGLTFIDHLTHNVYRGNMDKWAQFYQTIFNFREIRFFNITGKMTGLISRALASPCDTIKIPLNESKDDTSQIEEFLHDYHGEGIQHIALSTQNIYHTVHHMREQGIHFLDVPDTYYEMIGGRLPWHQEPVAQYPERPALVCDNEILSYRALDEKANQLAHYLRNQGVTSGTIVGILLERSLACYIAILATLKAGAAYVPLEVDYPDERINYILADLPFAAIITQQSQLLRSSVKFTNPIILDQIRQAVATQPTTRLALADSSQAADELCYVIYTSGSTGKPKGVEILQRSIVHYVNTASTIYQMSEKDRVYQGFSLAFDASLEELWMAFANGAALIVATSKDIRSGVGLIDFLRTHQVSFFSTVPTLLASLHEDLPNLRMLVLGGEVCSPQLVARFQRPGLTIINTYGPTEATVIATYGVCGVDKEITIGQPLPGYEIFILNDELNEVAIDSPGEICIGGMGLARGYVNQPQMTQAKFISHPKDPSKRIYRTGDLGAKTSDGQIRFLGRVDDQIKLRGFRIELNEIEAVLAQFQGIDQAVVSLQELDHPTLVAYLKLDPTHSFDIQALKQFLQAHLPHYMIPVLFEYVDHYPLLSSGKVNRKALPKPTASIEAEYVAPSHDLEHKIAAIWQQELKQSPISVTADFFYDLGGHSLTGAKVVSQLRQIPGLQGISILDLYNHPTIQQLAKKFSTTESPARGWTRKPTRHRASSLVYSLCAVGQFFGCLFQYAIGAWQLLAIVLCYEMIATTTSFFSKESGLIFLGLLLGLPVVSLAITIGAKWLLVGRIKPGVYKLWGWFYWRWWLVERLQSNVFSPHHLIGTPLINLYYRLLGAKIGKNCYIGSAYVGIHDLLTLGDNTSIGYDARLLGYVVEDGWLKIGSITIGKECFVGARSVLSIDTVMADRSKLDDMSMLPSQQVIPANQYFSGSPACQATPPAEHITTVPPQTERFSSIKNVTFGVLHYLGLVFAMMIYYVCYFPALLIITQFNEQTHYLFSIFIAAPIAAIIFLGLYYLGIICCKKFLMNRVKPGIYPVKSLYYLRQWIIVKMIDNNEISAMADSLYFPWFLRFLGAKLGKHVEMGETPHLIPDLLTIQDEGFTASYVAIAWPSVYQGSVKFGPVHIGKRGFVGNESFLTGGTNLGEGGLIGCMTITPNDSRAAENETAWLGSPAVFLPNRELFIGYSDEEKYTPSRKLVRQRLAIEFARVIMPTTLTLIGLFNMLYIMDILLAEYSLLTTILVLPIAELVVSLGLVSVMILLKWILLGKVKPETKPVWNVFIWKNDVVEYLYSYFVSSQLTDILLGTPFVSMLLRLFGTKIGKRVYIETPNFTEFDLISIGDEVCINSDAVIQTHLYEDRVFKMSCINIDAGCNVGGSSIVLYNTIMEKNATLGNLSLLMKGETLPEQTRWQGIPAQPTNLPPQSITEPVVEPVQDDDIVLEAG